MVPPKPAKWEGFYMPREWAEQVASGKIAAQSPLRLQTFAMYLLQNPQALATDNVQQALVGLYSCADSETMNGNEVRAPALKASAVARFREFVRTAPTQGMAGLSGKLGKYDAAGQRFGWDGMDDRPLRLSALSSSEVPSCVGAVLKGMDGSFTTILKGEPIPGPRLPTAEADRFLQSDPNHYIDVNVYFAIPSTPTVTAGQDLKADDDFFRTVKAEGTIKRVVFAAPSDKRVLQTYQPQ